MKHLIFALALISALPAFADGYFCQGNGKAINVKITKDATGNVDLMQIQKGNGEPVEYIGDEVSAQDIVDPTFDDGYHPDLVVQGNGAVPVVVVVRTHGNGRVTALHGGTSLSCDKI